MDAEGAATAVAVMVGALAQSVSGIGFVLVCGPLLFALLGPATGVRLAVVLSLALNIAVLAREHRHVRFGDALLLLVPAVVVTPIAAAVVRRLDRTVAAVAAGVATVIAAAALAAGLRLESARGRTGALVAGAVSATMNVVAAIGGPAVALYAANAEWPAAAARSTLQAYFLVLNVVALASLGRPDVSPGLLATCLGAMAAGLLAGVPVGRRLPEHAARAATLALATLGGVFVVVRALL